MKISGLRDIPLEYRNTPLSLLLEYHNLGRPFETYNKAQMLVGMCMDNRKYLHIPDNFAFIIRTGGANLRYSEFKVSYAVAVGEVRYIALIAHNNCGMVNLASRKDQFVNGLVDIAGWSREAAEEHFFNYSPMFEIGNEIDFLLAEVRRIRFRYPGVTVVPMYYRLEENLLHIINEI
ncbi:MAG: carbonic anhydrase [Bacteroidales bacterium]